MLNEDTKSIKNKNRLYLCETIIFSKYADEIIFRQIFYSDSYTLNLLFKFIIPI